MKPVRGGECPGIAAGVVLHAADLEEHHAAQAEEDVQFNPLGDHVHAGADDFGGADEGVEFDEHAPLVYPEVHLFLHVSYFLLDLNLSRHHKKI